MGRSEELFARGRQFFPFVLRSPQLTIAEDARALNDLGDPMLLAKGHDVYTVDAFDFLQYVFDILKN